MSMHKARVLSISASLAACTLAGAAFAGDAVVSFQNFAEVTDVQEFTGQMIVRPLQVEQGRDLGHTETEIRQIRSDAVKKALADVTLIEYVWQTDEYVIELGEGMDENSYAQELMATGQFDYVEPNWLVFPTYIPDDTRINNQWHHKAATVNSYGGWDIYTGDPSVGVGLCDTGVRTTHEDLLLHRLEGYNAVNRQWESDGGQINDINGHGTWVTGTACANGDNGRGVSGMGFDLSHRMLRVTNSPGGGAYISDLTHAARTAAEAGDRCSSVSYSGVTSSSVRTAATYCKSQGGLLFWAAGNEGRFLSGSRDSDDVLVIGATTSGDTRASFSNYGSYVDFMAGGQGIYTTDRSSNGSYGSVSGTSFACPMAAGLGGLIWSADPDLTPDEVEDLLKATCTDLGQNGVDNTYGYGRIDSADAMAATGAGPFNFFIQPAPPIIGDNWYTFGVQNGEANMQSAIFYSTKGQGYTQVAPGIYVDMQSPKQIPPVKTTNGDGDAEWPIFIPNVNIRVFLQGVQANGDTTDLIFEDIQ